MQQPDDAPHGGPLSEAELIGLFLETSQTLDSNFEFWLTVSFALLVASYLVTERLPKLVMVLTLSLYVTATVLFMVRGMNTGRTLTSIRDQLEAMNSETALISAGENLFVAVQVFGQRLTAGLALLIVGLIGFVVFDRRHSRGPRDLLFFQRQFKLIQGFGTDTEPVTPQTGQLMLELLDPIIALLEFRREDRQFLALGLDLGVAQGNHCPQCGQVIWQIGGRFEHEYA